jgi:hypothetical protein
LSGMQARRTANRHEIHGPVIEELLEVGVRPAAILAGQSRDFLFVRSIDGRNLDAWHGTRGARMRLANISATDKTDIRGHWAFQNAGHFARHFRGPVIIGEGQLCFNWTAELRRVVL